jgi:hypothetical protein
MSNATKLAAALGLAGAMLASSPASYAQDLRRTTYATALYGDCYYDPLLICGPVSYAAMASVAPLAVDAYAAANGVVQPSYLTTAPFFWRGLRGGDWVAIHGSGGNR